MVTIEIINNYFWVYGLISLVSLMVLIYYKIDFSKEALIDYCIYLTNKILLFSIFLSFMIISLILLLESTAPNTIDFTKNLIVIFLKYGFINYSILYIFKFSQWLMEMVKKNEISGFEFLKEIKQSKRNNDK